MTTNDEVTQSETIEFIPVEPEIRHLPDVLRPGQADAVEHQGPLDSGNGAGTRAIPEEPTRPGAPNTMATIPPHSTQGAVMPHKTLVTDIKIGDEGSAVLALQQYLHEFGYLTLAGSTAKKTNVDGAKSPPVAPPAHFEEVTQQALAALQNRAGLKATGELDEPTLVILNTPRCGVADPLGDVQYFRIAARWGHTDLTYAFENFTPDLGAAATRRAWEQAARLWSDVCLLTFREAAANERADLRVAFHRNESILDAFDGPSGVLAHAWYPEDGAVHFDEAELWTVDDPPSGIDLVTVAAHELGHALGLDHSQVPDTLMWPWYDGSRRALDDDDIAAIQHLYGVRDRSPAAAATRAPLAAAGRPNGTVSLYISAADQPARVDEHRQTAENSWPTVLTLRIPGAPAIAGRLAAATNRDGRVELFGRGGDDALWHTWQEGGMDGPWHAWESLGGEWTSDPSVAVNEDGRLEVFLRGTDSALWQRNQLRAGGPFGPGFGTLDGTITSAPSAVRLPDGRLQVFARGANDGIWTRFQQSPGGGWSAWSPAANGSFLTGPSAFVDATGMVLVLASGLDAKPWVIWGRGADGAWSGPILHGVDRLADGARIDGAINALGGLELFARFADGTLRHRWQLPAPAYWSDWHSFGGPIDSDPTVAKRGRDGRLEVFALSSQAAPHTPEMGIFRRSQTANGWI